MPASLRVSKEKYIQSMRAEMEGLLGEVMQAVNAAPGGRVIVDSEEQVRQLMHEFRQRGPERPTIDVWFSRSIKRVAEIAFRNRSAAHAEKSSADAETSHTTRKKKETPASENNRCALLT